MSPSNPAQDAFELWRKSLDEGTQAWLRALGQAAPPASSPGPSPSAPPFDFGQFWRPILTQGMEMWQKAATREGAVSPEFAQQWKGFMDQWIEAWSKALAQVMGTEGFAQALGRYLDQTLSAQAPVKKALDQATDAAVRTLGLPSRSQVVGLASQMIGIEERIEGIEDRLDELKELLGNVRRAAGGRERAPDRRAAGEPPRTAKSRNVPRKAPRTHPGNPKEG